MAAEFIRFAKNNPESERIRELVRLNADKEGERELRPVGGVLVYPIDAPADSLFGDSREVVASVGADNRGYGWRVQERVLDKGTVLVAYVAALRLCYLAKKLNKLDRLELIDDRDNREEYVLLWSGTEYFRAAEEMIAARTEAGVRPQAKGSQAILIYPEVYSGLNSVVPQGTQTLIHTKNDPDGGNWQRVLRWKGFGPADYLIVAASLRGTWDFLRDLGEQVKKTA